MFLIPFFAVLFPIFIGQRYGLYRTKKSERLQRGSVASIVAAAISLLAFMLAFTFQIAANKYMERKELFIEEITNIRTTYLRAGLVPEPFRSHTRKLLIEYVDLRVELVKDLSRIDKALFRSQQILDTFWNYAETLAAQDRSSEAYSLYTASVNDLVNNYNQRITATLEYRIPAPVFWVLFIITIFSGYMLGYQFGVSGGLNRTLSVMLATIFAVVMFLILALDRSESRLIKLNQKPMINLQQQLHEKQ